MAEPLLRIGAAYIHVSDERQDEYSPDSQLKKIREYAAAKEEITSKIAGLIATYDNKMPPPFTRWGCF